MWLNIFITIGTFFIMELVAWATHKYLMHGLLWNLHKDHHQVDRNNVLQKNDYFFLIFAIPGAMCIIDGITFASPILFIGIGISLYGLAYFIVHEIFIHQRIKILKRTNFYYLRAIRKAHKVHHKNLEKENGVCFGMLFVPFQYLKKD
jgi:beta-carotene 3-hydroxylase